MNKINGMRAKLLFDKFNGKENEEITFTEMINKVLTIPSYYEKECCTDVVENFPVVFTNSDILHEDLSNLQDSILKNFNEVPTCPRCKRKPQYNGQFGNHVLVEVSTFWLNKIK